MKPVYTQPYHVPGLGLRVPPPWLIANMKAMEAERLRKEREVEQGK